MKLKSYEMLRRAPNPLKILWVTGCAFMITFLFLLLVPWQQNAVGNGRVIAFSPTERKHTINAPITGRIKQWFVEEGQVVAKGDPIVEISDMDPELIRRLQVERTAIMQRITASEQALRASESNVNRQKSLYEQGISSKRQYELAQIEKSKYANELAQMNIDKVDIDVRIARQSTQMVTAQAAGVIFKRLPGQESVVVQTGAVLAEIIPHTKTRAVALYIDGNDIPFVRLKQRVRLQFEGWPAIQFRGWPELAVGTFAGEVNFIDATDDGTGMFRVVITPTEEWPDHRYLRQGVRVHGWVLLGEVPLWYEIWRQFNGFPPENSKLP